MFCEQYSYINSWQTNRIRIYCKKCAGKSFSCVMQNLGTFFSTEFYLLLSYRKQNNIIKKTFNFNKFQDKKRFEENYLAISISKMNILINFFIILLFIRPSVYFSCLYSAAIILNYIQIDNYILLWFLKLNWRSNFISFPAFVTFSALCGWTAHFWNAFEFK